jgi:hypothetical protein
LFLFGEILWEKMLFMKCHFKSTIKMKVYKKSKYKTQLIAKMVVLMAILGGSSFGVFYIFNSYEGIADFSIDARPDKSSFKTANLTTLEEIAIGLDERYPKYHLPLNQSTSCTFNNDSMENGGIVSYTNVSSYHFSDNEALWTGIDYVGWTYKYLSAQKENDTVMERYAHDVLINMTSGLTMLMIVPNGGLGPNFGGILGRGYAPPDAKETWPYIFRDGIEKHFTGTGNYTDWRWRGYTSNDEFSGYYLFLAMATKYLMNISFIAERVSLIVDQLCFNFLNTNFLGLHGSGATTGVDQKPYMFSGAFIQCLLLKLGAIHFPEKYAQKYYHQLANDMAYLSTHEGGVHEVFANYYAYNFALCTCLGYLILEDDPEIWNIFFDGYYNSIWQYTKNHRDAWSNSIILMIANECAHLNLNARVSENMSIVVADVKDQLQRFAETHYPDRGYLMGQSLPEGYVEVQPVAEFVDAMNFGEDTQNLLGIDKDDKFLNKPLTIDLRDVDGWAWNNNPFVFRPRATERLLHENTGSTFTVPYWMLRYSGHITRESAVL